MTGKVSKRKAKRACIDCHFLAEIQNDTEEAGLEPYEMEPKICHYYVEADRREPIKRNDYSWILLPLVCYRGCWTSCNDKEKQHEEVVEIDRSDCPLFFEYKQGMSFEAAEKTQDRTASLQLYHNKKKGKVKRACIDCHFLMRYQIKTEPKIKMSLSSLKGSDEFYSISMDDCIPLFHDMREKIKNKDYSFLDHPGADLDLYYGLGCSLEFWNEQVESYRNKRDKIVVETYCGGCSFLEYRDYMSFENAEVTLKKHAALGVRGKSNKTELKTGLQEVKSIETTLSYNKTTGKFRFGNDESIAISKTPRHKARNIAEKLMKCWRKGQPCPLSEFGIDPTKKTPTKIYTDIKDIRKFLKHIRVSMPQCAGGAYHPPSEPEHFNIVS